jgi:hypothetical protein
MRQRLEAVFSLCRQHFFNALRSNNLQISSTIAWADDFPVCPD